MWHFRIGKFYKEICFICFKSIQYLWRTYYVPDPEAGTRNPALSKPCGPSLWEWNGITRSRANIRREIEESYVKCIVWSAIGARQEHLDCASLCPWSGCVKGRNYQRWDVDAWLWVWLGGCWSQVTRAVKDWSFNPVNWMRKDANP